MKALTYVALTCMTLLFSSLTWSAVAGVVLISKGGAFATDGNGQQRTLKRRSDILEGDVVSTDANGMIQIRFVDKALLTLKANSQLDIRSYQMAKAEGGDEKVLMNLITGGFRTITGTIGKGEKGAYQVKTPAASIGIRGTNYEVAQEPTGDFVMAVWEGGISVSNEQGSLNIGRDSDYNFVRVNATSEPKGLEEAPDSFNKSAAPPPPKEKKDDKKQAKEKSKTAANNDKENDDASTQDEEDNTEQTTEESNTDEQVADSNSDEDSNPVEDNEASTDTNEVAGEAVEDEAKESQLEEELEKAEEAASEYVEDTPLTNVELITSVDSRLSDWEYSYLVQRPRAALLVSDDQAELQNGLIVQDTEAGTNPVFVIAGQNSGTDNNLETFQLDISNADVYLEQVNGSAYVSWGKWNGNIDILATPNDTNVTFSENHNFYWLSVEAASLSSLRGEAQFSTSGEHLGDINGQSITQLNGQFDVNFDTGAITNGSLNFGHDSSQWNMSYDGVVRGANATMTNVQGDISGASACSQCVQGDIQGIFARPGDQFVGGFQLQGGSAADGTTQQANGVFLLDGKRP